MVAEVGNRPAPGLVAPEWLRRQQEQSPASSNVNINDIYWIKPDGWIVVGPSAVPGHDGRPLTMQAESKMRQGWKPLIEFSYTNRVSSKTQQRETIELTQDRLATPDWAYWLFANGGAHLFPIEQIVEFHWHLKPPYYPEGTKAEDVFPQLAEWIVPEAYWCPACPGDKPPKNSEEQVSTHLIVAHSMTQVQVSDLWEQTDGFKRPGRTSTGLNLRRRLGVVEQQNVAQRAAPSVEAPVMPTLQICNNCGVRIEGALRGHVCANNLNHDAVASVPTVALEHAEPTEEEKLLAAATPPAVSPPAPAPEVSLPASGLVSPRNTAPDTKARQTGRKRPRPRAS